MRPLAYLEWAAHIFMCVCASAPLTSLFFLCSQPKLTIDAALWNIYICCRHSNSEKHRITCSLILRALIISPKTLCFVKMTLACCDRSWKWFWIFCIHTGLCASCNWNIIYCTRSHLINAFVNADYRQLTAIIALQIQQHFLCFISRWLNNDSDCCSSRAAAANFVNYFMHSWLLLCVLVMPALAANMRSGKHFAHIHYIIIRSGEVCSSKMSLEAKMECTAYIMKMLQEQLPTLWE